MRTLIGQLAIYHFSMTARQRKAGAVKQENSSIVHANVELWIHLGGLLSIQEASQSLSATPPITLALFSCLATSCMHP